MGRLRLSGVFANENGQSAAGDAPVPDVDLVDGLAVHVREVLFRRLVEGCLGPVVEVNLSRGPSCGDLFIVGPSNAGPSLALGVLEVHDDLASEDVPDFEIGKFGGRGRRGQRRRWRIRRNSTQS